MSGWIYQLTDEEIAHTRSAGSMATSLMNQNQLRPSTGVSLGYSMNTDSGPSEDDSDYNPWAELS